MDGWMDGIALFFCGRDGDGMGWDGIFVRE